MSDDKTDYLAEVLYDQTFAERMSNFRVLPHKLNSYSDWLALKTASAYIIKLEEENDRLKQRLVRLEE
jgi:hypothetical protein